VQIWGLGLWAQQKWQINDLQLFKKIGANLGFGSYQKIQKPKSPFCSKHHRMGRKMICNE
jgi:hypothetical protein